MTCISLMFDFIEWQELQDRWELEPHSLASDFILFLRFYMQSLYLSRIAIALLSSSVGDRAFRKFLRLGRHKSSSN